MKKKQKKIIKKYQIKWNQNNKRIVKIDNKYDKEININMYIDDMNVEIKENGVQNVYYHILNHDINLIIIKINVINEFVHIQVVEIE